MTSAYCYWSLAYALEVLQGLVQTLSLGSWAPVTGARLGVNVARAGGRPPAPAGVVLLPAGVWRGGGEVGSVTSPGSSSRSMAVAATGLRSSYF